MAPNKFNAIFGNLNFICLKFVVILGTAFAVGIGCGGGGGGSSSSASSGSFIDSPVEGLEYETDTQSGLTDADGTFRYRTGETVTFSLGDIVLGQGQATDTMTPIDIVCGALDEKDPTVTNICRLLQTLDQDGDLRNGIFISERTRQEIRGRSIDFGLSISDFENDPNLQGLLDMLNAVGVFTDGIERTLCPIEQAQSHMRVSLAGTVEEDTPLELENSGASNDNQLITQREWPDAKQDEVDELVAGNNAAAFDLYQQLKEDATNLFFSPYAVSRSMAMTAAGAREQTLIQIHEAMGFSLDPEHLHTTFNALDLDVRSQGPTWQFPPSNYVLNTAAGAWGQTGYFVSITCHNLIAANYGAPFQALDFDNQSWDSEQQLEA